MSAIDLEEKRYYISLAYSGDGWKSKVLHMKPAQVIAIYNNLKNSGRIDAIKRKFNPTKKDLEYKQISIAEYMEER